MFTKTSPLRSIGRWLPGLALVLTACHKELPISDLPRQERLTLNFVTSTSLSAPATPGVTLRNHPPLQLSRTAQGSPAPVAQAHITIAVNGQLRYDQHGASKLGLWEPRVSFAEGDLVTVKAIDLKRDEAVSATVRIPAAPQPFTVSVEKVPAKKRYLRNSPGAYDLRWSIQMQDPEGEANYYRLQIRRYAVYYMNNGVPGDFLGEPIDVEPDNDLILNDGEVVSDESDEDALGDLLGRPAKNKTMVFSDRLITGGRATIHLRTDAQSTEPYYGSFPASYYEVVLQAISRETFLYLRQLNAVASNSYDEEGILSTPIQFPSNTSSGVGLVSIASERILKVTTLPR